MSLRTATCVCCGLAIAVFVPTIGWTNDEVAEVPVPSVQGQELLIKNAIVAVNHGIITGNYTVLRDLASDSFRSNYKASELGKSFGRLGNVDLSAVLLHPPTQLRSTTTDKSGQLIRMSGYFDTQPKAVLYDLEYMYAENGWVLNKIAMRLTDRRSNRVLDHPDAPRAAIRRIPRTR